MHNSVKLFFITKAIRSFTFSTIAIVSPFYLSELGLNSIEIGFALFLSLLSTTIFVYLFGKINFNYKGRTVFLSFLTLIGLAIMIIFYNNSIGFIVGVIFGGISLTGRDLSAFQPIEQYTMSYYIEDQSEKNIAFSLYDFSSYIASTIGAVYLTIFAKLPFIDLFSIIFILVVIESNVYFALKFPKHVPKKKTEDKDGIYAGHIRTMSFLFSLDALGGSLVATSMLSLWFLEVYHISLSTAGFIFSIVSVTTAISILVSSKIQNNLGLIKTMVYTHLISNGFLIFMPIIHNLYWSEALLYLRQTTSQMDVPARGSFINTFYPKDVRIAANTSFTSARSASQMPGPILGTSLLSIFPSSMIFLAGGIKVSYDLLLYWKYRWFKK